MKSSLEEDWTEFGDMTACWGEVGIIIFEYRVLVWENTDVASVEEMNLVLDMSS